MDISQLLLQAQNLIQNNQINQARVHLREIIQQYPSNEQAWLLTACITDTVEQSLYCLQQAMTINPQSQVAQKLLQQTERTRICPSIDQLTSIVDSVENIQKPNLPRQDTSPQSISILTPNESPTSPHQPAVNVPSASNLEEKKYFHDNQIFVSSVKIVFNQTTVPIFQVISSSHEIIYPVLTRILGGLLLLIAFVISLPFLLQRASEIFYWIFYWKQALNEFSIYDILTNTLPNLACIGFFLILGFVLFFVPKKKYRVSVETPAGQFPVVISKEQKYTDAVSVAINKALIERGSYIPQPGYYQGAVSATPSSKIAWSWIIFLLSFVIPITFALLIPFPPLAWVTAAILQFTALGFGITLSRNPNPTAKANGLAITIIWLVLQCISGIIGFLVAVN